MGKYEKRRAFRQFRKAGIPFVVAQVLARCDSLIQMKEKLPEGWHVWELPGCECCAPTQLKLTMVSPGGLHVGPSWTLCRFTLRPV